MSEKLETALINFLSHLTELVKEAVKAVKEKH